MNLKSALASVAAAVAMISAPSAHAAYSITFQNTTFTITQVDSNTFTLQIQNLLNATGDWADVTKYGALAFKDVGTGFTGATITPDGSNAEFNSELDSNGCKDPKGNNPSFCFTFAPLLAASNNDMFTIDVTGASLNFALTGPHLKVNFMNAQGTQIGNLLSQDLPSTSSSSGSSNTSGTSSGEMPEPGSSSLALLGLALIGGALAVRRKQQAR
jgi:MYXO-CTERM domain-containing protein